jgi:hypothetical protein
LNHKWLATCVCIAVAACNSQQHQGGNGTVPGLPDRPVVVPAFDVTVELAPAATAELKRRGETIKVLAVFDGSPNARGAKYAGHEGGIVWSDWQEIEIKGAGVARFGPRKLNLALLDYLEDRKPEVLINVVSGRRTSEFNLLDCGIFADSVYLAVKKGIPIQCSLIDRSALDAAARARARR